MLLDFPEIMNSPKGTKENKIPDSIFGPCPGNSTPWPLHSFFKYIHDQLTAPMIISDVPSTLYTVAF